jgi:hypothetical protein
VISLQKHYFIKYHFDSTHKYFKVEMKKMLKFLIDNIFVVAGGQVFQQSAVSLMGTNCAPLLVDLFLHSYEAEFNQKLLHEKKISFAVAFSSTFRYINDVLSINNGQIHTYVDTIYLNELEVKDTTECSTFTLYLNIYTYSKVKDQQMLDKN